MKLLALYSILLVVFLAGCSKTEDPVTPEPVVSFRNDVRPVFNHHCTGCHFPESTNDAKVLDLQTDAIWQNIVNHKSPNSKTWYYIIPNNPQTSLLYLKVSEDIPPFGIRMPAGTANLTMDELLIIKNWIQQGAKNN